MTNIVCGHIYKIHKNSSTTLIRREIRSFFKLIFKIGPQFVHLKPKIPLRCAVVLANMALLQINQRYVTTEEFEFIFDQLWTLNQKFRTLFLYEKGLWWMCHLINIKCVNESFTYKLIAWNLYENFDLFIVFVKYENSNANYFQKNIKILCIISTTTLSTTVNRTLLFCYIENFKAKVAILRQCISTPINFFLI